MYGYRSVNGYTEFVADVAREFLPEKVILFGSYATATAGAESDVDLLVAMSEDVSGVRVAADIITRLKTVLPVELVVRSSLQIKERLALNDVKLLPGEKSFMQPLSIEWTISVIFASRIRRTMMALHSLSGVV